MSTKTKPIPTESAATLTGADLDDFIADVRMPALWAERDDISAQLARLFQSIGYAEDSQWEEDKDATAVQRLLSGGEAKVQAPEMPSAALHHHLKIRRRNIDRALHLARPYAERSRERRQAVVVAAHRAEIVEVERERVLLAIKLQAINRKRDTLRNLVSARGGCGVVLPTDSIDLLDVGYGDDDVDRATKRVLADGILTQSEVNHAKR